MVKVKFYNDKGNPLSGVRKKIKDQVEGSITINGENLNINDRGEMYLQIAEDDSTGNPIYAVVSVTISDRDIPARAKTKGKKVETEEVPDIFA